MLHRNIYTNLCFGSVARAFVLLNCWGQLLYILYDISTYYYGGYISKIAENINSIALAAYFPVIQNLGS